MINMKIDNKNKIVSMLCLFFGFLDLITLSYSSLNLLVFLIIFATFYIPYQILFKKKSLNKIEWIVVIFVFAVHIIKIALAAYLLTYII
jgi:hypothetical protein